MMKLYLINMKWKYGEIKECEVVKETEKTYLIRREGRWESRVRKSEMKVFDSVVCTSMEEAIEKKRYLLETAIEKSKEKIKLENGKIERFTYMLEDMKKGGKE